MVNLQINLNALITILLAARIMYLEVNSSDDSEVFGFLWFLVAIFSLIFSLGGLLP